MFLAMVGVQQPGTRLAAGTRGPETAPRINTSAGVELTGEVAGRVSGLEGQTLVLIQTRPKARYELADFQAGRRAVTQAACPSDDRLVRVIHEFRQSREPKNFFSRLASLATRQIDPTFRENRQGQHFERVPLGETHGEHIVGPGCVITRQKPSPRLTSTLAYVSRECHMHGEYSIVVHGANVFGREAAADLALELAQLTCTQRPKPSLDLRCRIRAGHDGGLLSYGPCG